MSMHTYVYIENTTKHSVKIKQVLFENTPKVYYTQPIRYIHPYYFKHVDGF